MNEDAELELEQFILDFRKRHQVDYRFLSLLLREQADIYDMKDSGEKYLAGSKDE